MNLFEIFEKRVSRRSYNNKPLTDSQMEIINKAIQDSVKKYNAKAVLMVNDNQVFKGLNISYGMFSGVKNYIILYGKIDNPTLNEEVGLLGEEVILKATEIGLGTCWVGGTYNKKLVPIVLEEDEKIVCIITIGEVNENPSFKEKMIKKVTKRKTKSIEEMITSDVNLPEWIVNGMKAVQLAPSAVNRQPVKFTYKDHVLRAYVDDVSSYQGIDLGIAKLHFSLGSEEGSFLIGNNKEFKRK